MVEAEAVRVCQVAVPYKNYQEKWIKFSICGRCSYGQYNSGSWFSIDCGNDGIKSTFGNESRFRCLWVSNKRGYILQNVLGYIFKKMLLPTKLVSVIADKLEVLGKLVVKIRLSMSAKKKDYKLELFVNQE